MNPTQDTSLLLRDTVCGKGKQSEVNAVVHMGKEDIQSGTFTVHPIDISLIKTHFFFTR